MKLMEYLTQVMREIDGVTPIVTFTVGLNNQAEVDVNSRTTVSFTVISRPTKANSTDIKLEQLLGDD